VDGRMRLIGDEWSISNHAGEVKRWTTEIIWGEKKHPEMREWVSRAVSSFSHALQVVSSFWKFHAIILTV